MIVDASALVAIVLAEPQAPRLLDALATARPAAISAATALEVAIVIDAKNNPVLSHRLDALLDDIAIVPVTAEHARIARAAYRDYGRGSGHGAKLNFGDCFSYALAAETGKALLYVGDDFARTDLDSALDGDAGA
ncbi:MAG TPA: type II toxin-antitoxin system VapC family toxin [Microbacterium sp.]|nr:type II toxin-antitoxin system VapC family toxin [Microbacterium sp.]